VYGGATDMHPVPRTFWARKHTRFDCEIWCVATRKKDIKQSFGIAPPASKNDYPSENKNAEIEVWFQPSASLRGFRWYTVFFDPQLTPGQRARNVIEGRP
jgi:hypothetical protein